MSERPEKKALVDEIHGELEGATFVFLADYRGMSVEQLTDLRGKLDESRTRMTVVKNSFLRYAAERMGWRDVRREDGPTAMISGAGDVTVAARVVRDFAKQHELPVLKGGRLGADALTAEDIVAMAGIPSREVLLARVVGTIAAPMSQLAGVMRQKLASLVYVLRAVEEKKSDG